MTLREVHDRNIIHRNITPEHLVLGTGVNSNRVHMIGFSLSTQWFKPISGEHQVEKRDQNLYCSLLFASIWNHQGNQASRRDDLVSLGFVLAYLLQGDLPWAVEYNCLRDSDMNFSTVSDKILEKKRGVVSSRLFDRYPAEFANFLDYATSLSFSAEPNYQRWIDIFRTLIR
jgi:serine/threonine protein kinase